MQKHTCFFGKNYLYYRKQKVLLDTLIPGYNVSRILLVWNKIKRYGSKERYQTNDVIEKKR